MSAGILHFLDKSQTVKSQTFTSSGTFIVPSGITNIIVEGQGAGGAGFFTSGGGAGHFGIKFITVTPNENVSVTIGVAGNVAGNRLLNDLLDGGDTIVKGIHWSGGQGGDIRNNGAGNGGNGGYTIESGSSGPYVKTHSFPGTDGPHFKAGDPTAGSLIGAGGGSGLGIGSEPIDGGLSVPAGVGAGGCGGGSPGTANITNGGRGQVTIYWIDPS